MRLLMYVLIIAIIILSFPILLVTQDIDSTEFVPGELFVTFSIDFIELPLEVYALHISYDDSIIKLIEAVYQEFEESNNKYRRIPSKEHIVDIDKLNSYKAGLKDKIKIQLSKELINLFKEYGVFYIERLDKTFSPQDTLPHTRTFSRKRRKYLNSEKTKSEIVKGNIQTKLIKSRNENRFLFIRFNKSLDARNFAKKLSKLKGVVNASTNDYTQEFY